ncbi:hypothetical protein [Mycobacterium sp. OTB74]|uniref:hypothetical protein n=1 Tax=Mycobacterium sp. OTB74 TaxID=1853452 RepID=UPI0024740E78|nr:hypothetical protein [Mycobacterium sp. OTB74]
MRTSSLSPCAVVALAAIAALAVSGCGSNVLSGNAVAAGGPSEATPPLTAGGATPVIASKSAVPQWIDASGAPVTVLPRDDVDHAQFSAIPQAGTKILHATDGAGDLDLCTLGPTVTADGRTGFLTAGHCVLGAYSPDQYLQTTAGGATEMFGIAGQAVADATQDSTVIWANTTADPRSAKIAGLPVVGAMTEAEVKVLPPGTPVCFDGAKSGVTCGPLIDAGGGVIYFGKGAVGGDSGAPVFVVDRDGRATVIGLLARTDDDSRASTATYTAPALARLGVTIVTAP